MPKLISILYEDEQCVVFDKPAGVLVTPAQGNSSRTLTERVNGQSRHLSCGLHPCHRLDRMTSGAIIYAKGKRHQQMIRRLFQDGRVSKIYLAFVRGCPHPQAGLLTAGIKDFYQQKYARTSRARSAQTRYQTIRRAKGFSVVQVQPRTGRTNQIRIHFSEIGSPLLGERVYAFRRDFEVDMKRLALHCHILRFENPVTGGRIRVVSGLPNDMAEFLKAHDAAESKGDFLCYEK